MPRRWTERNQRLALRPAAQELEAAQLVLPVCAKAVPSRKAFGRPTSQRVVAPMEASASSSFDIQRALLSTYKKRGEPDNWPPIYQKWHDAGQ
jgi:hypothetical protein